MPYKAGAAGSRRIAKSRIEEFEPQMAQMGRMKNKDRDRGRTSSGLRRFFTLFICVIYVICVICG
jgi:hypothetical protein